MLGVSDILNINDKSGELGVISTNEMRNHISVMIRHWKPEKLFLPDPYMHYEPDWDQYFTGKGRRGNQLRQWRVLPSRGNQGRPTGPRHARDLLLRNLPAVPSRARAATTQRSSCRWTSPRTSTRKRPRSRCYAIAITATPSIRRHGLRWPASPPTCCPKSTKPQHAGLIRAYVKELAEAIGKKHGFQYGEEFNYHGRRWLANKPLSRPGSKSALSRFPNSLPPPVVLIGARTRVTLSSVSESRNSDLWL